MGSVRFNGFVGGSYRALSPYAACDRATNLFPEINESGTGVAPMSFYSRPGTRLFATLPGNPVKGLYPSPYLGKLFAFGGHPFMSMWEVFSDATLNLIGTSIIAAGTTGSPCTFASDGNNLAIADRVGNLFSSLTDGTGGLTAATLDHVSDIAYLNGYFLALRDSTLNQGRQINASGLFDPSTWDPADSAVRSTTPDQILRILNNHDQLWLFGRRNISVWSLIDPGTSGAFPFIDYPSGAIDMGIWAPDSLALLDGSPFLLAGDVRGVPMVIRINGYTPQRISDYALEQEIARYGTSSFDLPSDAVGYTRTDAGHLEYVLSFTGANKTKVYDVTTGKWHDEGYWSGASFDPDTSLSRTRGNMHAFASPFPHGAVPVAAAQHFLGDYQSGNIYTSSIDYYDDAGNPILWQRTAPHLNLSNLIERHVSFEVLQEQGIVSGATPIMYLEISNDGGKTFGTPLPVTLAANGASSRTTRAWWRKLGRARDRVYRVTRTDANRQAWIDGLIRVQSGNGS